MISKELLSEVIKHNVIRVDDYPDEFAMVHYEAPSNCRINIYQLAHKCKEWAHHNGYWMDSCFTGQIKLYHSGETYPSKTFHTEITEYEAIFKACEWILNQKAKELRTSKEWYDDQDDVVLMDPDGWDRSNYEYSFNEEKITKEEFNRRLAYSTCRFNKQKQHEEACFLAGIN